MTTDVVSIQLARCILRTAKLRDDSYDKAAAERTKNVVQVQMIDFTQFYKKPIRVAALEACRQLGHEDLAIPVYMMLMANWNPSIEWATAIEGITKKMLEENEIHQTIVVKRVLLELDKS